MEEFNDFFTTVGMKSAQLAKDIAQKFELPPVIETLALTTATVDDNMFQLRQVTTEEVSEIITMMPSNKAPGNDTVHLRVLKDCLSSVVQPITSIINSSFLKGIFHSQWKISEITPIPKNDDYEEAENNRPISLLPVLSKVCERVVHNQFTNYLIQNERFATNQSGNRKQHSTETLGLAVTDHILDAMDRKQITAMVLLDFTKAFDSISHSLLLKKLQNFGVSPNALRWFASYLFQRKQQVRIGKTLSSSRTVTHGVPQGSILGPLLFNLYIYDLPNACTGSEIDSFVDDTKLYAALKVAELADGLNLLTNDLKMVAGWCCSNQLLINPEKLSSYCLVLVNYCNKGQSIFNCRSLESPYVQQNVLKILESSSTKIFPMMSIPAKLYLRVIWH